MKKILLSTIIAIAATFTVAEVNAQAFRLNIYGASTRQMFYYYPAANVYYSAASRRFIYPRNGVWISASVLPYNMHISNTRRFTVYHYGSDVWTENSIHAAFFKPAIMYKKPVTVYYQPYNDRLKYRDYTRRDNDDNDYNNKNYYDNDRR
ncbi:MAG: hypothetical protein ACR2FN_01890 [Chitinophagaceae bacterium]